MRQKMWVRPASVPDSAPPGNCPAGYSAKRHAAHRDTRSRCEAHYWQGGSAVSPALDDPPGQIRPPGRDAEQAGRFAPTLSEASHTWWPVVVWPADLLLTGLVEDSAPRHPQ